MNNNSLSNNQINNSSVIEDVQKNALGADQGVVKTEKDKTGAGEIVSDTSDILLNSPTISPDLYLKLPDLLKNRSDFYKTPREKDVFLTTAFTILSGLFPTTSGIYDQKRVFPNLFSFVIAPAASGKSALTGAKDMAQGIHNLLIEENKPENALTTDLDKPAMLYIPGNTSAASIIYLLQINQGIGIICETEADSMSNNLREDWGNFSDILRKAFHHENISYSRKKNNEYIEIRNPKLSVSLSGTPNQVPALIKSIHDGLFSRFIFYIFRNPVIWKDVSPSDEEEDYTRVIDDIQEKVKSLYDSMRGADYSFDLKRSQWTRLNEHHEKVLRESAAFIGEETTSIVMRSALTQFRLAMTLSILRNFENGVTDKIIVCDDVDYSIAAELSDIYLQHSMIVYKIMTKHFENGLSGAKKQFFESLPHTPFRRKEAEIIGEKIGIASRTVTKYLRTLVENKFLIQKNQHGPYERPQESR